MRIGFVGAGRMGAPMVRRLTAPDTRCGYWDVTMRSALR